MAKLAVIIAAAGKGRRFDSEESKVLTRLDGRPVFLRTLERFVNRDDIVQTLLVLPPDELPDIKERFGANLGFMGVQAVAGGDKRHASVAQGLQQIKDEAEYVLVHDAVRPCVTDELIDAVIEAAENGGAAIAAMPLQGTIKRVSESNVVDETVDRTGLYEAQTPQVFKRSLIDRAYENVPEDSDTITDDAQLIERLGEPVHVVVSDATNIKITTKGDVSLANAIIKSRPSKPKPRLGAFDEAQW